MALAQKALGGKAAVGVGRNALRRQINGQHLPPAGIAGARRIRQLGGLVRHGGVPADPDAAGFGGFGQGERRQCAAHHCNAYCGTGHGIPLPTRHNGEHIAEGRYRPPFACGQRAAPDKTAAARKDQHRAALCAGDGDFGAVNTLGRGVRPEPHRQAAPGQIASAHGGCGAGLGAVWRAGHRQHRRARVPPQRQKAAVRLRNPQRRHSVVDLPGHKAVPGFWVIRCSAPGACPSELHCSTLSPCSSQKLGPLPGSGPNSA